MEPGDLLDRFQAAADLVNFYWNFYVIGIVAVLGWIFSLKRDLARRQRIVLTAVYVGFVVLNLLALVNSYRFLEAARLDALVTIPAGALPHLSRMLDSISFAKQQWIGLIAHIAVDATVIAAIWLMHVEAEESPAELNRSA
jgi:hypothetical protein